MGTMRYRMLVSAIVAALGLTACSGGGTKSEQAAPLQYNGRPGRGGEVRTADDPQSTFAVDVDTASYGYARRQIDGGHLPDRDTVRPEEFVNALPQGYPDPPGDGLAIHPDGARLPETHHDAGQLRLLRIGLQTRHEDLEARPDAALTFVIDVSGSMAEPGRLDLVQDALHTLVDQLRPTDSVAIVAYSTKARVVREMTRVERKRELHDAIDDLKPEASTNLEAGLVLGYQVARDGFREGKTNRVIILSDGLANVGNTEAEPILAQIREEARKQITLMGVGVGSSYGDALMERLADSGDGFVVYAAEQSEARRIFVEQLPAALAVRALDAKVQVTFDAHAVVTYRLIGYENRAVNDEQFRNNRVDGGEVGPGHSVTALYAVRLADRVERTDRLARVDVRWLDPGTRKAQETTEVIEVADVDGGFDAAAPQLRVSYAAAYLAEVLRGTQAARDVRLADLREIVNAEVDRLDDPAVDDLAAVISQAARLIG